MQVMDQLSLTGPSARFQLVCNQSSHAQGRELRATMQTLYGFVYSLGISSHQALVLRKHMTTTLDLGSIVLTPACEPDHASADEHRIDRRDERHGLGVRVVDRVADPMLDCRVRRMSNRERVTICTFWS